MSLHTTKWHVHQAKTQISLRIRHPSSLISLRCPLEETLGPLLPIKHGVRTLIRLGGCPGWSKSLLGAQANSWFCHAVAQMFVERVSLNLWKLSINKKLQLQNVYAINEPAHEIMVLITWATSEGSGEPAHPRSLARAFGVHTHEVWK